MQTSKSFPVDISQISAKELIPATASIDANSPEQWKELAEIFWVAMRAAKALKDIPDAALSDVVAMQVKQIAFCLGGNAYYIPNGSMFTAKLKSALIAKNFDGKNLSTLARGNGITSSRVRQILKEQGVHQKPKGQQLSGK